MTGVGLDFYSLFFQPAEWVGEGHVRESDTPQLLLWMFAASVSLAVGDMVAANVTSGFVPVWIFIGTATHLCGLLLAAFVLCAFAGFAASWAEASRLEGRHLFRLALLASLPWVLSAPLALIARYFDAVWTFWIPAKFVVYNWSLYLMYRGLRDAAGLSILQSTLVLILSECFVAVSVALSFFLTVYRLILQF